MFASRIRSVRMLASVTFRFVLVVLVLQSASRGDSLRPKNERKTRLNAFPKVVGGTDAPIGRFPYMCSLRQRGLRKHVCGGTLIKPQWVLTAAHCVDPKLDGSTGLSPIVYCGIYERDERNSTKVFASDRTTIHPEWNGDILGGFDIALVKLKKPCDAPLPDLDTTGNVHKSGRVFAALGWGYTPSGRFAELLQVAPFIPFVATRICNQTKYWDGQIKNSMICAGVGEQDTQQGDSGGPLLQLDLPNGDYTLGEPSYDLLVGITSFGGESEEGFMPGVYTRVGYFRDWIDCITKEKENCSNADQGTTESTGNAKESKSTASNATHIKRNTTQPSSTLEDLPSDTLAELSIEVPESLAEGSEEAAQYLEAFMDLCSGNAPQRDFNESLVLKRVRDAIKEDDPEIVEETICKGLSPNIEFSMSSYESNWSLLHAAAKYDAIKSARVLVDYGADIERQNNRGYHPLHIAAEYNSDRVAKLLIKSGADVEIRSSYGHHPLHLAAEANSSALLLSKEADIESRDDWNNTPLHRAADNGALEVTKSLVEAGANIKSRNVFGNTPLHEATWKGYLKIAKVLLDGGADVDVRNNAGQTPLHQAARANKFDVAKLLVKEGASKKKKNNDGDTPFDVICGYSLCSSNEAAKFQRLLKT